MGYKTYLMIIKGLYQRFKKDEVTALGAQMTYYLLLSFFPFLIFLITLFSYTSIASVEVVSQMANFLPYSAYEMVYSIVYEVIATRSSSLLSIGIIATLWTASSGVAALIRGINKAYDQKESRSFIKLRLLAMLFTLALTLVIVFSFVTLVFGEVLGKYVFGFFGLSELFMLIWNILRYIIPLFVIFFIFSFFYLYAPNKSMTLKKVWPGALFTTLGWLLISLGFSFYVNHFGQFTKMYGSIGGIIVLLIWLYISSIVVLLGGELNATLANLKKYKVPFVPQNSR